MKTTTESVLRRMLQCAREGATESEATAPDGFVTRLEARLAWPAYDPIKDWSDHKAYTTSTNHREPASVVG